MGWGVEKLIIDNLRPAKGCSKFGKKDFQIGKSIYVKKGLCMDIYTFAGKVVFLSTEN